MADGLYQIRVDFPVPVDVSDRRLKQLDRVVNTICRDYENTHLDRTMWAMGHGYMPTRNWLSLSDDEPQVFNDDVYQIEVAERERYPNERTRRLRKTLKRVRFAIEPDTRFLIGVDYSPEHKILWIVISMLQIRIILKRGTANERRP